MTAWRLTHRAYAPKALSAQSASFFAGRWNFAGVPALYAATTLSLAMLETIVHLDAPAYAVDLVAVAFDMPADPEPLAQRYPSGWSRLPFSSVSQALGTRFLAKGERLAALVSSAVAPPWYSRSVMV